MVLRLVLFVLPLGLDTFAVATALGIVGLPAAQRLRVSVLMSGFEMVMPIVGLLLGSVLGRAVGSAADYVAVAVLLAAGLWMLREDDAVERERLEQLEAPHGAAWLALGLSVSLDELAIGFSIGLLRLSLWIAVLLIGAQAFLFAQLGLRIGARVGHRVGEAAEKLAGIALVGLAALLIIEKVTA